MRHTKWVSSLSILGLALLVSGCTTAESSSAPAETVVESAEHDADIERGDEGLAEGAVRPSSGTEASAGEPEGDPVPPPPHIETPQVPICPYHEEVSQVEGAAAQVDKALELGCEPGIHGEIDFEHPIAETAEDATYGLISTDHALSVGQMCDEGYIDMDYCLQHDYR